MSIVICKYFWALRAIVYRVRFAHIGYKSYMGKPIFLSGTKNIDIGNCVRIFPGARMEAIGTGTVKIGNNTSIGQNLHMISDEQPLVIGDNCTLSGNVFISNTEHSYMEIGTHIMDQARRCDKTRIGNNCFVGYGAVIMAGAIVGSQCIIGANAVVKRGVYPDNCVLAGVPAKIIKKFDDNTEKWEKVHG